MVLFLIILGVVPLLVRAKVIDFTAPRIINPIVDSGPQVTLFTYYKWILVIIIAVIGLTILVYKIVKKKYEIQTSYIYPPLLGLGLLILASVMAADYKSMALLGLYNQRDGSLLLLAYLVLCLVAANTVYQPWFKRGVDIALLVLTAVNAIIMLVDFSGYNLLQNGFIQAVMAPPELRSSLSGNVSNTMGNANYVSGFAAALFAYFSAGILLPKNIKSQVIAGVAALAAFVMVLISFSSSGFVTLVIISPLFLIMILRSSDRRRSLIAGGIILSGCLLLFMVLNSIDHNIYGETVGLVLPQATQKKEIKSTAPEAAQAPASEFKLPKPGWSPGTGRTYIWNETLKLTNERPWLGYGYGSLAYYFPQDDINKVANLKDYNRLVTKPHSLYMGIAYGLGIPALVVLLALFVLQFYYTGRRLWSTQLTSRHIFPASLFLFFCAFMVQALFNDPVVETGAIFWILLGVAASFNKEMDQPSPTSNI